MGAKYYAIVKVFSKDEPAKEHLIKSVNRLASIERIAKQVIKDHYGFHGEVTVFTDEELSEDSIVKTFIVNTR